MVNNEILNKIVEIYKERLAENPGNKDLVLGDAYRNARLLEGAGFFQLAKEAYERVLLVDPPNKQAKAALARIASFLQ